jgi:hypothetical protein
MHGKFFLSKEVNASTREKIY